MCNYLQALNFICKKRTQCWNCDPRKITNECSSYYFPNVPLLQSWPSFSVLTIAFWTRHLWERFFALKWQFCYSTAEEISSDILMSQNTHSHSACRYRSRHSCSPNCCFALVFCHGRNRISPLALPPCLGSSDSRSPSQELSHGCGSVLSPDSWAEGPCSVLTTSSSCHVFCSSKILTRPQLGLHACTFCTPWWSFLSIFHSYFSWISC